MVPDLSGRHVFLTGAAGGMGRVLTAAFLDAGAVVSAADIAENGLLELQDAHAATNRLATQTFDIADHLGCAEAVATAAARSGDVDILINCAAPTMSIIREDHQDNLVTIDEIEPAVWDQFMITILGGAFYLTRAVVPGMRAKGWGRIITITTSFFTMLRPKFHPYGPAKAGLEAMAAGHAGEFRDTGITVNIVVPGGPTDTPMVPAVTKMKRSDMIQPEKMATPMLWLCSEEADEVTGMRYVAAHWDENAGVDAARAASEAPIAWPDLAQAPVWPGGNPDI